jgi:hypothetical protein
MTDLRALVAEELSLPVDPRVTAMAEAIAAKHRAASQAVLFYGSCLREQELEGRMLDFYLIVSDYRAAYGKGWLALANRLIPPNVFYFELDGLAAKYAVLSEADFTRECSPRASSVSVWARFAQPSRLVWVADGFARQRTVATVASAAPTLFQFTLPLLPDGSDPREIWRKGFELTYGAELRAERRGRAANVVEAWPERYKAFTRPVLAAVASELGVGRSGEVPHIASRSAMRRRWRLMQWKGKALSVIRLVKASATFAGGAEYIAWKINRHAGTNIQLKPWQQRHPLLAGISLLPRLLKSGAVR